MLLKKTLSLFYDLNSGLHREDKNDVKPHIKVMTYMEMEIGGTGHLSVVGSVIHWHLAAAAYKI